MSYIIGYEIDEKAVQALKIKKYFHTIKAADSTESCAVIAEIKIDVLDSDITIYNNLSDAKIDLEKIQNMKDLKSICPQYHKELKKAIPDLKIFKLVCKDL